MGPGADDDAGAEARADATAGADAEAEADATGGGVADDTNTGALAEVLADADGSWWRARIVPTAKIAAPTTANPANTAMAMAAPLRRCAGTPCARMSKVGSLARANDGVTAGATAWATPGLIGCCGEPSVTACGRDAARTVPGEISITVAGTAVDGTTVEGTCVDGTCVAGTCVDGTTVGDMTVDAIAVDGTCVCGTTVGGTTVEGTSCDAAKRSSRTVCAKSGFSEIGSVAIIWPGPIERRIVGESVGSARVVNTSSLVGRSEALRRSIRATRSSMSAGHPGTFVDRRAKLPSTIAFRT